MLIFKRIFFRNRRKHFPFPTAQRTFPTAQRTFPTAQHTYTTAQQNFSNENNFLFLSLTRIFAVSLQTEKKK